MSILVLSALIGVALIIAALFAVDWLLRWDRTRAARNRPIPEFRPEFRPRRDAPRTITRITKDQIDWEIN